MDNSLLIMASGLALGTVFGAFMIYIVLSKSVDRWHRRMVKAETYAKRLLSDETRIWKCDNCGAEFISTSRGNQNVFLDDTTIPCGACETGKARPLYKIIEKQIIDAKMEIEGLKTMMNIMVKIREFESILKKAEDMAAENKK